MSAPKTLVLTAMENERAAVCAALEGVRKEACAGRDVWLGTCGTHACGVMLTGIGKVNAAAATQWGISVWGAGLVVTAGVVGGFRHTLKPGDVLAVRGAIEYDFDLSQVDDVPVGQLPDFTMRELPFTCPVTFASDVLATGDHFRRDDADVALLQQVLNVGMRDMEGAAVAHVALKAGVRVAGLKAISNVWGAGDMIAQYRTHCEYALTRLTSRFGAFLDAVWEMC